ncbi:hypothetical protein EsDP_00003026 [Epichloe bromicola]|uniref:ZNFX1 domain-containing protein n=1 Tax=Epichloe bromicola TaxID=79588 RepID=A0ABQ0CMK0_9HYPO
MSSFVDFFGSGNQPSLANWLELSEIPLADELTAQEPPKLPLNDFENRHQLRDQYLETQYRLHRFEATEPLRRAIQTYRRSSSPGDTSIKFDSVNLYTKVHATGYALGSHGATQRLSIGQFPHHFPLSDEEDDKADEVDEVEHLTRGTLLALSADHFRRTCHVAIVAENDGLLVEPPYIDVF